MLGVKKQRSEGSLPPPPPPAQRHVGYQCRGCTQSPILGIRHHSLKAVPADGAEIDFCSRCILGPLGQMCTSPLLTAATPPCTLTPLPGATADAQDHGPYFEEIYAPTGGAHARDVTGNELFAMLTSEDLLDELRRKHGRRGEGAPPGALAWAWLNLNETSAGARMAAARSTAALPPKPAAVGSPPPPLLPRVPMSPTSTESWSTYG